MEARAKHPRLCAYQGLHWPHTKVLLTVLLIFSAWLFPGLAWCPQTYTFRHDGSLLPRCSASYLTNVAVSAQHNSPRRAHLSPPQVSIRVRQQKPNWHRKVNAHGWVFTFIFKPHTVSKPAETASGNSVHWPCAHTMGRELVARRPMCSLSWGCWAVAVTMRRLVSPTAH